MVLTTGQRLTLLKIDDALAMTHRYELEVRTAEEPHTVGYMGRLQRVATVRQRGKRKEFYLDLAADDILLDGWDAPFRADTECAGVIAGNACFNLIGEPEAVRQCLETKALRPLANDAKAKVIVWTDPRTKCNDEGAVFLWPDIVTGHAVVQRMRKSA